jgi:archaellum biogenesis ATPase FlaH
VGNDEKEVKYRCLRDLVFQVDSGTEIDDGLIARTTWEHDVIRQAIETPHAIVSPSVPTAYFEVKDYRLAWKVMLEGVKHAKPGERFPQGVLLSGLTLLDGDYFRGHAGEIWLEYLMNRTPCEVSFVIEDLLPRLHARHDMRHWKLRNQDYIDRIDNAKTDPATLHTEWRMEAYAMSQTHDGGSIGKSVSKMINDWDPEQRNNRNIIPLGIDAIDKWNGGGHGRGELMVIGGGTSHGKSYMAQRLMRNQAKAGNSALYISVEDSDELFTARFIADYSLQCGSRDSAIAPAKIRDKSADPELVHLTQAAAKEELGDKLYYFDAKKWTISKICDVIRRHKALCSIDVVIVDYLQAIMPDEVTNQKTNDTAFIVAELKKCCHECEVALILLSQYARDEYRNGAEPTITSCKWAGEIENEAEIMLLLWRDDQDVLHARVAKLKWSRAAGRRYIVHVSETTGVMLEWEDDWSVPEANEKGGGRRRRERPSGEGTI